ncbi:DUF4130 domain-containing protein [Candidatus Woesearchaeota archaeon]|jgi:probable DNA metabolism protein|nr:DUF4130 domain-containing protein [Candidatus Woesearchaeota archaeon]MBT3538226.1 DUF4130 domain-containing protein [Candidatus Woesearchaeota archaeon]MBT4696735.1 DUF4130 domain-containing protein [Candidatus Woesearchaeota archaeon]MBT4717243.1 DUF4130 domain-containing protein [Candidatus Woesearchaeota archaeon]MBT7105895.1 DUF4130 domain-containing protein [Candidatus Woesearchaeota archaeon]
MKHINPKIADLFDAAHRHKEYSQELLSSVMQQDYNLVKNNATPEAKKLFRMQSGVLKYFHLKRCFMRLEFSKHGILYCKTELEHKVVDMLLSFFHKRFPIFHIAIQYKDKTYVINTKGQMQIVKANMNDTIKQLERKLPLNDLLSDLDMEESLWEDYYNSQYIKERRNVKLMNQMMPLKYRDQDHIESTVVKRCQKLTDFM